MGPFSLAAGRLIIIRWNFAGFFHFLGNMFILYLAGPFIEDRWGRPLFAGFYILAGIFAALFFVVQYPGLEESMVGASGAISGVMGAFLIRFWFVKIKFFYFFFFFMGTFNAPAWFMLPLWLARELIFAQAGDVIAPEGGTGVAHWAHVAGFVGRNDGYHTPGDVADDDIDRRRPAQSVGDLSATAAICLIRIIWFSSESFSSPGRGLSKPIPFRPSASPSSQPSSPRPRAAASRVSVNVPCFSL